MIIVAFSRKTIFEQSDDQAFHTPISPYQYGSASAGLAQAIARMVASL
jgi:hypothetical protein